MTEFTIIENGNFKNLTEDVNAKLSEGWTMIGAVGHYVTEHRNANGVKFPANYFYVAMQKEIAKKGKKK